MIRTLAPYAAAFALGLFLAATAQHWRYTAQISEIRTQHAAATQQAEQRARQTEQSLQQKADEVQANARDLQDQLTAAVHHGISLRDQLAERTRRASSGSCTATGSDSAHSTLLLYSELLDRADRRAEALAGFADAAHAAGLNCEILYNNIRQAMQ